MDTLLSFGAYDFPAHKQVSLEDNFTELVPILSRLAGTDGAYDEYGSGRAPQAPGRVRASIWLQATEQRSMQALRDAMAALAGQGRLTLRKRADDGRERECSARLRNIQWPSDVHQLPHAQLLAALEFTVPDPGWKAVETTVWDGEPALGKLVNWNTPAAVWDAPGNVWGGAGVGSGNNLFSRRFNGFLLTVRGQGVVLPRITLELQTGSATVTRVTLQRRSLDNIVLDELRHTGELEAGNSLVIDCRHRTVERNGDDVYADFSNHGGDWLPLASGRRHRMYLLLDAAGASVRLQLEYNERYYT